MRTRRLLGAAAAVLLLAGCGAMDLTPEGNPARVLMGEIDLGDAALPAGATATVRVVDATASGAPPDVLGSATLAHLGDPPYAFRVEYRAEDDRLRRGLNIEVRVSSQGKVRFFNRNHYAITLGNASDPHRVHVDPAAP